MAGHMHSKMPYQLPEPLTADPASVDGDKLTLAKVNEFIDKHEMRFLRYNYLENLYKGFHDVFKEPEKPGWKPDNRLAVNFPRELTDTFTGYAYGIPIRETSLDEQLKERIDEFCEDNEMGDHELEMAKLCCIYGHAFEYLYQDEESKTKVVAKTPKEVFVVYDDTEKRRALFAVRYGRYTVEGKEQVKYGEIMTRTEVRRFDNDRITETLQNPYGLIPVVEWRLNEERMGLYEGVAGLIEAYNHTIGEKANDVDAFAEAYLAIMGAEVDEEGVRRIRDDRLINIYGTDNAQDVLVQFLQKPTADGTQENLLNRLEKLIYQKSMVANINDETFGTPEAGIALEYKLNGQKVLASTFDNKVKKSIRKRYKIFCSLATNSPNPDAWKDIEIIMTRNIPHNVAEEINAARNLEGMVSKETQLSMLSIIDDIDAELERIEAEKQDQDNYRMQALFGQFAKTEDEESEDEDGGVTDDKS